MRSNRKRHRPEEVVARLKRADHRVSRDNAHLDSSPETSDFRGLRAVWISPEAPRLLMSSCISGAGIVNQRHPRAQPVLSILGRKPPYARRKTRTRDFSLGP